MSAEYTAWLARPDRPACDPVWFTYHLSHKFPMMCPYPLCPTCLPHRTDGVVRHLRSDTAVDAPVRVAKYGRRHVGAVRTRAPPYNGDPRGTGIHSPT